MSCLGDLEKDIVNFVNIKGSVKRSEVVKKVKEKLDLNNYEAKWLANLLIDKNSLLVDKGEKIQRPVWD